MSCSDVLSFQAWVVSLLVIAVESRHTIKPLGCRTRANYVFVAKKNKSRKKGLLTKMVQRKKKKSAFFEIQRERQIRERTFNMNIQLQSLPFHLYAMYSPPPLNANPIIGAIIINKRNNIDSCIHPFEKHNILDCTQQSILNLFLQNPASLIYETEYSKIWVNIQNKNKYPSLTGNHTRNKKAL